MDACTHTSIYVKNIRVENTSSLIALLICMFYYINNLIYEALRIHSVDDSVDY